MNKMAKLIMISALAVTAILMIASSVTFAEKVSLTTTMPRNVRGVSGIIGTDAAGDDWSTVALNDNSFYVGGHLGIGTMSVLADQGNEYKLTIFGGTNSSWDSAVMLVAGAANCPVGINFRSSTPQYGASLGLAGSATNWTGNSSPGDFVVAAADNCNLVFSTDPSPIGQTPNPSGKMIITPSGNVGIGTNSPGSALDVIRNTTGISISPGDGSTTFGTLAFNRGSPLELYLAALVMPINLQIKMPGSNWKYTSRRPYQTERL